MHPPGDPPQIQSLEAKSQFPGGCALVKRFKLVDPVKRRGASFVWYEHDFILFLGYLSYHNGGAGNS